MTTLLFSDKFIVLTLRTGAELATKTSRTHVRRALGPCIPNILDPRAVPRWVREEFPLPLSGLRTQLVSTRMWL